MKKLDVTALKNSVVLYIAIAMLVLTTITVFTTAYTQNYRANMEEKKYNKQVHLGIEHVIKHYIHDYKYEVRRLLETTNVAELLKSGDRDALYNKFKPKWDLMTEEEENLEIMHFHLSDGSSFLRMHKPELYGDKIDRVRPMLQEIHKEHKSIDGYETGKHATNYRILSPIFDESGEYIGALELGLNPEFILSAVLEINGFCGMMFIKEESLDLYSTPNKIIIDGYRLQSKLSAELKKICGALEIPNKLEDGMEVTVDEKTYKTHLFTLDNYENRARVKIIFFQDTTTFGIFRTYLLSGLFVSLILIISGLVWLIYRRIGLYQNDVTAAYQNQIKLLNESEHRFELLYRSAPEAYQSLDIDGNIITVNLKWLEDLDYSDEEEVLGKNFGDFLAPGFREKFKENFPKFKEAGGITDIEFDMVRKDGGIVTVSFNGKIVNDDENNFKQTHCIFTNITEQKQARDNLENSERFLKAIFDINPNIMIRSNGESIETVNPAMLSFFGYESLEEFSKEHSCVCDFFIKGDECLESEIDGVNWLEYILNNNNRLNRVCMLKNSQKHHFTIEAHSLDVGESKRSIVFFNDVTEIEETGRRLEYAVKGANDGLWDWDIEQNTLYLSPRYKEMIGYQDVELMNIFETWKSRIHPDDLDKVLENVQNAQSTPGIEYKNTHRLRHKDGHWVWILDRGQTIFDKSGKAVRMVGFHTDISELKELEMQLRKNEQIYYDFFEHTRSANIMYETDDNGKTFKIKNLNALVEKLENVKKEEIVGKRVEDVFEGIEEFGLLDIFKEVYRTGKPQQMPLSFYEDKKLMGWRENYVFKLLNGDIVSSYEDKTEEKRLENELTASQKQFELFMEYIPGSILIKDENLRIIYANSLAKSFFNNKNIIGLKAEETLSPEDVASAKYIDSEILQRGFIDKVHEFTNYNNEKNVYRTMGFVIENDGVKNIGTVIVDITKEFTLQEELKKEGEKSKQLGEFLENSINEVYIFAQDDLKFLYLNGAAIDNIGYSLDELKQLTPINIKPEMTHDKFEETIQEAIKAGSRKIFFSTVHQRKNGTQYPVDIYLQTIQYQDTDAYIAFIIDTTERMKSAKELLDKEELMIAQSRHAAMGEMISMIAHQWRQPISVISMDANNILADIELEMIQEKSLKSASQDIIKQTQELSKTIDDFRNFFRPEKEAQEVLVKELFDDALAVIGKSLQNSQVEFILKISEDKKITTYTRELMQVFINIIKNAKEALIDKKIENKKITVYSGEDGDNYTLRICDNAGGVAEENMEKIFNPYFTTKGEKNGTGLGLYMSKTIVEKHLEGYLNVVNDEEGACFEITIPHNIG